MVLTHFDNFGFLKVRENSAIDLFGEIPCGVGGCFNSYDPCRFKSPTAQKIKVNGPGEVLKV